MGQCIYKCFVRLFLVFPVDQFDWLGEKNQQPYGGVRKNKDRHPCKLVPGAKAVVLMICTGRSIRLSGFFFRHVDERLKPSETLEGAVAELMFVAYLVEERVKCV